MLTRKENWQSLLAAYLDSCASARFRYGRVDCGLFVAGAVHAMTGVDVVPELRGKYANRREAFEALRKLCGKASIEAAAIFLAERAGLKEISVLSAQRGDAVLSRHGRHVWLGLVAMHGTEELSPGPAGILRFPLSHATRAWRV